MGIIRILALSAFLLASFGARAQTVNADFTVHEISKKKYYLHKVEAKQTLYGISKAYKTKVNVIQENNPQLKEGLKVGMELRIPLPGQDKGVTYKKHIVKPKETLYGISKTYHLSIEDLLSSNPALSEGLKVGMELRIPNKSIVDTAPQEDLANLHNSTDEPTMRIHAVQPKETWYSLSKKYGLTIEEIKKANPNVMDLQIGSNLLIPKAKEVTVQNSPNTISGGNDLLIDHQSKAPTLSALDTSVDLKNKLAAMSFDSLPIKPFEDTLRIAYMLPFFLDMNDTLHELVKHEQHRIYQKSNTALDMYFGALVALDSLDKLGVPYKVKFYETQNERGNNNDGLLTEHTKDPFLATCHVIYGPLYLRNFELIAEFGRVHNIPVLSPVPHSAKILKGNPYIFKLVPGKSDQVAALKSWVSKKHATDNVIVLDSRDIRDATAFEMLATKKVDSTGLVLNMPIPNAKTANMAQADPVDVKYKLNDSVLNIIVIPSENESFVTKTLKSLYELSSDYDILVYGMSSWSKYHYIDVLHMVKLNVHLPVPALLSSKDPELRKVRSAYYAKTNTYPSDYSLMAFDATMHFALAFGRAKGNLRQLANYSSRQVAHQYRFKNKKTGDGWQNMAFMELEYENFEMKESDE